MKTPKIAGLTPKKVLIPSEKPRYRQKSLKNVKYSRDNTKKGLETSKIAGTKSEKKSKLQK